MCIRDSPWAYRTYSKKGQGRSAESHYPTMCIEDIKALPVGELAAKDCALFLWITFPCLCEALEVLTAWGFSYKTVAFVWVKQNRRNDDLFTGMGYWLSLIHIFSPGADASAKLLHLGDGFTTAFSSIAPSLSLIHISACRGSSARERVYCPSAVSSAS